MKTMTNRSLSADAADQFFLAVSQQSEKNRSSAPFKNRVGHTVHVGLSIVKLVGLIVSHSQACGIGHGQTFAGSTN